MKAPFNGYAIYQLLLGNKPGDERWSLIAYLHAHHHISNRLKELVKVGLELADNREARVMCHCIGDDVSLILAN